VALATLETCLVFGYAIGTLRRFWPATGYLWLFARDFHYSHCRFRPSVAASQPVAPSFPHRIDFVDDRAGVSGDGWWGRWLNKLSNSEANKQSSSMRLHHSRGPNKGLWIVAMSSARSLTIFETTGCLFAFAVLRVCSTAAPAVTTTPVRSSEHRCGSAPTG